MGTLVSGSGLGIRVLGEISEEKLENVIRFFAEKLPAWALSTTVGNTSRFFQTSTEYGHG